MRRAEGAPSQEIRSKESEARCLTKKYLGNMTAEMVRTVSCHTKPHITANNGSLHVAGLNGGNKTRN